MSDTTSSPFLDALTDPRVSALLGMAQGFGQAAMPTRTPTPFGAVLGQGMGGLLAGVKQGQEAQLQQQQLQQAKIGNQRANMLLDWYKNQYGGNGGGTPFGVPSGGGSSSPYLIPPQQLASMAALAMGTGQDRSAATLYGLTNTMAGGPGYAMGPNGAAFPTPGGAADPRTVATKSAAEKGFTLTPDGRMMPISGGEADPAYKARVAGATTTGTENAAAPFKPPITVDVPEVGPDGKPTGNTITKQVPVADWAKSQGAAADPFPAWSKKINMAESGGGPNATNPASTAAGKGQFIDGTWPSVIRATRPDLTAGKTDAQIMALRDNGSLADAATEQYARMNGATLAQRGLPVNGTTVAMAHGFGPAGAATILSARPDAPMSMLPGMGPALQANPQYANMTAGQVVRMFQQRMGDGSPGLGGKVTLGPQQEADLKVDTARRMPVDLKPGGMWVDPGTGRELKNPELKENHRADGTTEFIHINPPSPNAPDGTPGTASPVVMNGAPVGNAVPRDVQEGRDKAVENLFHDDAKSFIAANNTQGWLNQINHAAEVMSKAGPLYQTGPYAEDRMHVMGATNDLFRTLGIKAPFNETALASAEEMRKATTTAGFELSTHYEGHARAAASTIMNATSAVPGMSNSPRGVVLVSNGINEGAQSAIDLHNYKMARYQGQDPLGIAAEAKGKRGGYGLETAETDFAKAFPASMYADRAISTVQPFKITSQDQAVAMKEMSKYLPGTIVVLPNGKLTPVPPRDGAPGVPGYINNYLTQGAGNAP